MTRIYAKEGWTVSILRNRKKPRFCVIGAGNGGIAMAGHLGIKGFPVTLYNRTASKLEAIHSSGGVNLDGAVEGFGPVEKASDSLADALDGADVIMVVTPASAHPAIARAMAPYLKPNQVVVLNPGRTGGALEFSWVLRSCGRHNIVAEAQTFIYASRHLGGDRARIYRIKRTVPLAAFPASETQRILRLLRPVYPQFKATRNVLHTSLLNMGAMFHPAPLLLNAARIENGESFDYYHEGFTPAVASIVAKLDGERMAVSRALEIPDCSVEQWLRQTYGTRGTTLYECIQNNHAYAGIKAPSDVNHRYIFEDVPTGLVPIASLGRDLGVPTPHIDSIIELASCVHGTDYWQVGRTTEKLGLKGLSVSEMHRLVETGRATKTGVLAGWLGGTSPMRPETTELTPLGDQSPGA